MIQTYVIVRRNYNIVKASLDSIIASSDQLEITVVNPNDHLPNSGTSNIRSYLRTLVKEKCIKRALFFEENVDGWALQEAIKQYPPSGNWFYITDGDLLVPKCCENVTNHYIMELDNLVTGYQLSRSNYQQGMRGFNYASNEFGCWMMGIDTDFYVNTYGLDNVPVDSKIIGLSNGWFSKINEKELYHLTWDIGDPASPYYDKEYVEYKKTKSFQLGRPDNMNFEVFE